MIRRAARRAAKRFLHGPAAPLIRHVLKTLLLEFHLVYGDPSRLRIAPTAKVSNAVFNTVSGRIDVRDHAFFGFNVAVLTGTHDYTRLDPSRQNAVTEPTNQRHRRRRGSVGRDQRHDPGTGADRRVVGGGLWLGRAG